MTDLNYPDYIENDVGLPVFRGPYMQKDANLASFLFEADSEQLRQLCDRYLNTPSDDQWLYEPVLVPSSNNPYVMLILADMKIYSLDPEQRQYGWMHEVDLAFWVLVSVKKKVDGVYVFDHLAYFLPYVFVNDPYAILAGREVYGFRKTQATFTLPEDIRNPEFSADTLAFKTFNPDNEATMERLMTTEKMATQSKQSPSSSWENGQIARDNIIRLLAGNDAGHVFVQGVEQPVNLFDIFAIEVPILFLKQFRHVADTTKACYQAIVEAPAKAKLINIRGGGILQDRYQLFLNDLASHPIASELGLKMDGNQQQEAAAGFWIDFDFTMEEGSVQSE